MPALERRNVVHDKLRLAERLTGVLFAVVLITVQLDRLIGFATTKTILSDHSAADLWVAASRIRIIDQLIVESP